MSSFGSWSRNPRTQASGSSPSRPSTSSSMSRSLSSLTSLTPLTPFGMTSSPFITQVNPYQTTQVSHRRQPHLTRRSSTQTPQNIGSKLRTQSSTNLSSINSNNFNFFVQKIHFSFNLITDYLINYLYSFNRRQVRQLHDRVLLRGRPRLTRQTQKITIVLKK
jgi:hypothetical protein